jgi:hypothetical protein
LRPHARSSEAAERQLKTLEMEERATAPEENEMKTYQVSDAASEQYRGSGHALVAIAGGKAVAIEYIRDIMPELGEADTAVAVRALNDRRLTISFLRLLQLGDVVAAIRSSREVVEIEVLWTRDRHRRAA